MPLPKTILVPTDFGEASEAALDYAIELAKALGGQIVVMHAYEIPIIGFPDGALVATADLTSRILDGARAGLDRQVSRREGSGVTLRSLIKQADAYRAVNEAVEELGCDLVVMGTHGRKGIPRMLIGSVAERVVRTATVPVLTVHAPGGARTEEAPRPVRTVANGREAPGMTHR